MRLPTPPFKKCFLGIMGAGIVGGLSIAVPALWPLIFLSPIPLIDALYRKEIGYRALGAVSLVYGAAFFGTVLYWVFNAYPLDWAGYANPFFGLTLIVSVWALTTAVLALGIALWAVTARFIMRRNAADVLIVPISWVVFEWVRMWFFTLLAWGPGSILDPYFSFGMVGYALGNSTHLVALARFGGVYALGIFVVLIAYLVWAASCRRWDIVSKKAVAILGVSATLCTAAVWFIGYVPPHSTISVAVLSSDFASEPTVSDAQQAAEVRFVQDSLQRLAQQNPQPDVVVLPEDLRFFSLLDLQGVDARAYLRSAFGDHEVLVIDSARTTTFTGTYETVYFYSSTHGLIAERSKRILVPIGEYVPTLFSSMVGMIGLRHDLAVAEANRNYLPGSPQPPVAYHGATLVALLCSEMIDPDLYHRLAAGTTNPILLNLSSQSDFHGGSNPFNELQAMMSVQSAWDDAPYFQSTNGGAAVRIAS